MINFPAFSGDVMMTTTTMMTFPAGGWSWWRSPDVGWGGALVRGWGGPNALYRPAGGCTAVLEPAMELVLCQNARACYRASVVLQCQSLRRTLLCILQMHSMPHSRCSALLHQYKYKNTIEQAQELLPIPICTVLVPLSLMHTDYPWKRRFTHKDSMVCAGVTFLSG